MITMQSKATGWLLGMTLAFAAMPAWGGPKVPAKSAPPAKAPAPAPAPDPNSPAVEAERLFIEAKRLMAESRVIEACHAFEESQRLDPAVGTQFNIADCYERQGSLATAYKQFSDLRDVLARVGDDRAPQAGARAQALEARLPRVTIRIPWEKSVGGLLVTRDDETVDRARFGVPEPVNPGVHKIRVQASNKKPFEITVQATEGKTDVVDVPALADVEKQVVIRNTGFSQRNIGLVVGGVGLAAIGTSVALGLVAKSNYDSAVEGCTDLGDRWQCPPGNKSGDASAAQSMGTAATIVGAIGGAAVVAGGVLWFLAPRASAKGSEKQASGHVRLVPILDPTRAGLLLSGTL